jgi:hypothetical protein
MAHIQILPGQPVHHSGNAAATGKPFHMIKQAALLVNDDGSTEAFTYIPPRGESAVAPGKYALGVRPYVVQGALRLAPVLNGSPSAPKAA